MVISAAEEAHIANLLEGYRSVESTKKDIVLALNQYRLQYNLENFVFNDGSSKKLFTLSGTIPVVYKNNTYYIPISIVLMDTHPHNTPMCFVKPTPTMQIKVSMFVDHNGKVYLPYLHEWSATSDLLGLIQVMIMTFGDFPPVFSKQQQKPQRPTSTPYPTGNSMMPIPGGAPINMPMPEMGGGAYPPYPMGGAAGGPGYPPTSFLPNAGGYMPPMLNQNASTGTGTITEEHIKVSLVSAVVDKLRRLIIEKVNQCQAEIDTLNRTKQELEEGSSKIDNIVAKLQREERDLIKNIAILKSKEDELDKSLETFEKMDGVELDEAVVTTAPLYRQLLNAYAEEAAIEDAIYYLGDSLRKGVIDLEVYLKHVRQLSRKQYMLRAIMQRCRQKAGLAGYRN
ncbi:TSG101 family protein [Megaselia abdita]